MIIVLYITVLSIVTSSLQKYVYVASSMNFGENALHGRSTRTELKLKVLFEGSKHFFNSNMFRIEGRKF